MGSLRGKMSPWWSALGDLQQLTPWLVLLGQGCQAGGVASQRSSQLG